MRCIKNAFSETSLRSLRSSLRRLWVPPETVILWFQIEAFLATYWSTCVSLNIFPKQYRKLLRAWFKPKIYSGCFYKRKIFLDQMVHLRFPTSTVWSAFLIVISPESLNRFKTLIPIFTLLIKTNAQLYSKMLSYNFYFLNILTDFTLIILQSARKLNRELF